MLLFLFNRLLYTDLLICGIIFSLFMPKRNACVLRLLATAITGFFISLLWHNVILLLVSEDVAAVIDNFSCLIFAMLVVWCYVDINIWSLLFLGIGAWFCQFIVNAMERLSFPAGNLSWSSYFGHNLLMLAVGLLIFALFFRKVNYEVLKHINFRYIYLIWFIMCFACLFLNTYSGLNQQQNTSFYLAELLCCVVGLLYQHSLYRFCGYEREETYINSLLAQSQKQYERAKDDMEQINIKSHDLRYQIERFRQVGQVADSELDEMEEAINAYDATIHTGNPALDVLLTEKSLICLKKHIGFTCMADGKGLNYIQPGDLYAIFGNALENAIEACEKLKDPEKKQISLVIHRDRGFCLIYLQNYAEEKLKFTNGLPETSKKDYINHGYGLKSMKHLTEKYNGELSFKQSDDIVELFMLFPAA